MLTHHQSRGLVPPRGDIVRPRASPSRSRASKVAGRAEGAARREATATLGFPQTGSGIRVRARRRCSRSHACERSGARRRAELRAKANRTGEPAQSRTAARPQENSEAYLLSSHSRLRREVVPHSPADPSATAPPPAPGDQLELALDAESDEPAPRKRWAWLLKHVFAADLDTCPRCGGPMRWMEAAATAEAARDLLARLGLAPRPPPAPHPPPLGQLKLPLLH